MSLPDTGASRSRIARPADALPAASPIALAIVLAIGLAFVAGFYLKTRASTARGTGRGPIAILGLRACLLLLVLPMLPFALALREIERGDAARSVAWPIALLMLASFGLQLLGMLCRPKGSSICARS